MNNEGTYGKYDATATARMYYFEAKMWTNLQLVS